MKDQVADMSAVSVKGNTTLSVGTYRGYFIGSMKDSEGTNWVTVSSTSGVHTEALDAPKGIADGNKITFNIELEDGCGLQIKGRKYRLWDNILQKKLTNWTTLANVYKHVEDNNIQLASLKLKDIAAYE